MQIDTRVMVTCDECRRSYRWPRQDGEPAFAMDPLVGPRLNWCSLRCYSDWAGSNTVKPRSSI
jgi:hypothetical protein